MSLFLFPTSLNTEDFVNRVDQAHRLYRTTRPSSRQPMQRGHLNGMLSPSNTQSSALHVQPDVAICALYDVDAARLVADTAWKLNASSNWHLASTDFQQCV